MTHSAKILAHSISPDGVDLASMEVCMPRIVLAEFNTHRMLSRNSASSRAIPVEKMIRMVQEHPYIPTHWGKNQKGMQAEQELSEEEQGAARMAWCDALLSALKESRRLLDLGVHKQITNRLLEPFLWHTVIVTATEWSNFFNLRCHPMAHPEIRKVAELMRDALAASKPKKLDYGEWHLPLWDHPTDNPALVGLPTDERGSLNPYRIKVSVGRCARVSYLTHDGKRDIQKDIELHDELLKNGHMSPFEHVARPMIHVEKTVTVSTQTYDSAREPDLMLPAGSFCGNFRGWVQYRKTIPGEADILSAQ